MYANTRTHVSDFTVDVDFAGRAVIISGSGGIPGRYQAAITDRSISWTEPNGPGQVVHLRWDRYTGDLYGLWNFHWTCRPRQKLG